MNNDTSATLYILRLCLDKISKVTDNANYLTSEQLHELKWTRHLLRRIIDKLGAEVT